ncbi:hypothetical protein Drose_23015 [Dactylosporangium roseum]|uniref:Acyltransferase n=1 Tax=Dactylosporangium roseum TaxID=47989 RepID=A0ABY5YWJ7_9ACTN|nr:hypothetical protein [Dactylosporangium roseum]UWZ34121.1 hypothetical protein Drose_23015 [Dactylosporangium roseum]
MATPAIWRTSTAVAVLRRPVVWAPVAVANLAAMTLFLWHQTALLLVTFAGLLAGRPAGLLDEPDGAWPLARLLWLPVFALVLAVLAAAFHRFEAPWSARPGTWRRGGAQSAATPPGSGGEPPPAG